MVEADAPAQHDMKEVSASGRVAPEWTDALLAAALLAVDPPGLGGAVLRANAGPVRDRWMEEFRSLISGDTPLRRVPSHTGDERLLGGLDLAATLKAGRPVLDRGILADVDGGVLIVPMAERMAAALAARLVHVMDRREVAIERDGIAARIETRFGVIALDEGIEVDERAPAPLMDRLAFHLDLSALPYRLATPGWFSRPEIETARQRLSTVVVPDSVIVSLCTVAVACGIGSLRAPMLALAAARAAAAL
ncbi:MAG: magnesium chelatase ATPase subunit D, partial [Pseudomonadota bacterium]